MPTETLRRRVDLNDISWITAPGEYRLRGIDRADRARIARIAKKAGFVARTSTDVGFTAVDIREA